MVYAIAICIPILHPAVVVPYGRTGYLIWFLVIPLEMIIAYILAYSSAQDSELPIQYQKRSPAIQLNRFFKPPWLTSTTGILVILFAALIVGNDSSVWWVIIAGISSFILTLLVFRSHEYGYTIATVELFFVGYICVKMLRFSRSSVEIAEASSPLIVAIFLLSICGFLLHAYVIYFAAFRNQKNKSEEPKKNRRSRQELILFAIFFVPLIVFFSVILPTDFVSHNFIFNDEKVRPPSLPIPINDFNTAPPDGNLQGNISEKPQQNNDSQGQIEDLQSVEENAQNDSIKTPNLEGIPASQWDQQNYRQLPPSNNFESPPENQENLAGQNEDQPRNGSNGDGDRNQDSESSGDQDYEDGENKQYAVMIIASKQDPIYAAGAYFGELKNAQGLLYSEDEPLNELVYRRLIESWNVLDPPSDLGRTTSEYAFFSTITERVIPYYPMEIEPSIQRRQYHPFDLSYRVVSLVNNGNSVIWSQERPLTNIERKQMKNYLEVPLDTDQIKRFQTYLEDTVADEANYYSRIELMLQSFETHQYQVGFTDDISISHVNNFLFKDFFGDCTEFSNAAAILGRILGVPSRVVTGYIGTKTLQTAQHIEAATILRRSIEPLQSHATEDLYLITTAHRHSWAQFWFPNYGWIDFETTTYAKVPNPGTDANSLDIVIPLIEVEEQSIPKVLFFPWRFIIVLGIGVMVAGLSGTYTLRYGHIIWMTYRAQKINSRGLIALGKLLLMRMANAGCSLKSSSETIEEYALKYPKISHFSSIYTMLRYRTTYDKNEFRDLWLELRSQYRKGLQGIYRRGIFEVFKRTLSLRSLYYR